tara:strand:+ start:812 stop:988 length:177 start_codon:yes stop_codon:yes gene_type:complete
LFTRTDGQHEVPRLEFAFIVEPDLDSVVPDGALHGPISYMEIGKAVGLLHVVAVGVEK